MQNKKKNKFKTKSLRIPLYLSSLIPYILQWNTIFYIKLLPTSTYKFYIAQKNHDKKISKSPYKKHVTTLINFQITIQTLSFYSSRCQIPVHHVISIKNIVLSHSKASFYHTIFPFYHVPNIPNNISPQVIKEDPLIANHPSTWTRQPSNPLPVHWCIDSERAPRQFSRLFAAIDITGESRLERPGGYDPPITRRIDRPRAIRGLQARPIKRSWNGQTRATIPRSCRVILNKGGIYYELRSLYIVRWTRD